MSQIIQPNKAIYVLKKRSAWPWIIAGILIVILGVGLLISLASNVALIKGKAGEITVAGSQERFSEEVISGEGEGKIVIIPVKGFITFADPRSFWDRESMGEKVEDRLLAAGEDPAVKAVILDIDSPGGSITASDIIYHRVKELGDSGKVVVASFGDLAASGGYYLACPSDYIVAHPTTITGSIGVIIQSLNLEGLLEKVGIKDVTIKKGKEKDLLSPFREMTIPEREMLQGVVDEMYDRFLEVVSEGRNLTGDKLEDIAGGRIFTGPQALANGLVDEIGYQDTAIEAARELAGLEEATVIEYRKEYSIFELFQSRASRIFQSTTGFSMRQLLNPQPPQILYLWAL
ncbi:MAG: signal peptide peptidase SppA [Candidatus Auribacterota bacterium]|nr:signal peptide peptidase SppA [Candidatus Auribacterota bacterium]